MTYEEKKELWGEDLFKVFANHINQDGWLTEEWASILENEVPELDNDYNDNPQYKEMYQRMHLMDFEDSEDGEMIRPILN